MSPSLSCIQYSQVRKLGLRRRTLLHWYSNSNSTYKNALRTNGTYDASTSSEIKGCVSALPRTIGWQQNATFDTSFSPPPPPARTPSRPFLLPPSSLTLPRRLALTPLRLAIARLPSYIPYVPDHKVCKARPLPSDSCAHNAAKRVLLRRPHRTLKHNKRYPAPAWDKWVQDVIIIGLALQMLLFVSNVGLYCRRVHTGDKLLRAVSCVVVARAKPPHPRPHVRCIPCAHAGMQCHRTYRHRTEHASNPTMPVANPT